MSGIDHSRTICGCVGCVENAVAIVEVSGKGERTVCKQHRNEHRVVRYLEQSKASVTGYGETA